MPNSRRCDRHAPRAQAQNEAPKPHPSRPPDRPPSPSVPVRPCRACAAAALCRVWHSIVSLSVPWIPRRDLLELSHRLHPPPDHDLNAHMTNATSCRRKVQQKRGPGLPGARRANNPDFYYSTTTQLGCIYTSTLLSQSLSGNPPSSSSPAPVYKPPSRMHENDTSLQQTPHP